MGRLHRWELSLAQLRRKGWLLLASSPRRGVVVDATAEQVYRLHLVEMTVTGKARFVDGYANAVFSREKSVLFVGDVHIDPARRGEGRGTLLLEGCLALAHRVGAATITGSLSAIDDMARLESFYRRLGCQVEYGDRAAGLTAARVSIAVPGRSNTPASGPKAGDVFP